MEELKLGTYIKEQRLKHHMTQIELAQKLNVSNKAVSKWECGDSNPDLYLISKIATLFDVSIDELFDGKMHTKKEMNKTYRFYFYMNTIFILILFIVSLFNSFIFSHSNKISSFFLLRIDETGSFMTTNVYFVNVLILVFLLTDFFILLKLKRKGEIDDSAHLS